MNHQVRARRGRTIGAVLLVASGIVTGATTATAGGEPQTGGTLIVAGGQDVLYMDPTAAYSAADYEFQRITLRGLFDYQAGANVEERTTPIPTSRWRSPP